MAKGFFGDQHPALAGRSDIAHYGDRAGGNNLKTPSHSTNLSAAKMGVTKPTKNPCGGTPPRTFRLTGRKRNADTPDYYLEPADHDPFAQPMAPVARQNVGGWQAISASARALGMAPQDYLKAQFDAAQRQQDDHDRF